MMLGFLVFLGMLFALTPRRRETLEVLRRLTEQAGGAVHYSLVGARMRVSAWTAYGLLRELEAMGLVTRRYLGREPGAGGRSRILFLPASGNSAPAAGSAPVREALVEAFERFRAIADERAAARAYLAAPGRDLAFQVGFWLARLEAAGRGAAEAGLAVLEGGLAPVTKLRTVTALGLGTALARLGGSRLGARLTEASVSLSQMLEERGGGELDALVDSARSLPPGRLAT